MTENTAYTVRNDLYEVRELGIKIGNEPQDDFDGEILTIEEINLTKLRVFLADFGESLSNTNVVSIAVQDHGIFPKGTSNRKFRIQKVKELLKLIFFITTISFKKTFITYGIFFTIVFCKFNN